MNFTMNQQALLDRREIAILERINDDVQKYIIAAILHLNAKDDRSVITLYIDSHGGFISNHFHIIDTIINSRAPIHGIVMGQAGSAAFNILQVCKVRKAYSRANMMFHGPDFSGVRVDNPRFVSIYKQTYQYHQKFLEHLSRRSSQPFETWVKWSQDQEEFTGIEAYRLGIIDEIVTPLDGPWAETE